MVINVHAGHNSQWKKGSGAVGLIHESAENRVVKNLVLSNLRRLGHTVYDCTQDDGADQKDVLKKIVEACNTNQVDLDISIHFNAGRKDLTGDGNIGGTEIYVYNRNSKAIPVAKKILANIVKIGFRNRGIKYGENLYVLRNTKAPAILIECCFVDDKDDTNLYNAQTMAAAIVKGITGQNLVEGNEPIKEEVTNELQEPEKIRSDYEIFIMGLQYRLGQEVTGQNVNEIFAVAPTVSAVRNRHHEVVTPLERYLKTLGYYAGKIEADEGKTPIFGRGMTAAVNRYQKEILQYKKVDGEITAGKKMWKSLLKIK